MAVGRRTRAALLAGAVLALVTVGTAAPAAAHYVVASGDTLSGIASAHRTSVPALATANRLADADRIVAGQELAMPGRDPVTHAVQPGETLWSIARLYGISVDALQQANGLTDPDRIVAGSSLDLGGGAVAAAPAGVPAAPAAAPMEPAATPATADVGPIPAGGRSNPVVRERVGRLLEETAVRYGWRPATIQALALHESGWNNGVVSSTGAIGIMQIMPATGDWLSQYVLRRPLDLHDPADNVEAGVAYLDYLYRQFDRDIERTLASYYEGFRRVRDSGISAGGQRYVDAVLALRDDLS